MAEGINDIAWLIAKWLEGSLNEDERLQLAEWRSASPANEQLFQQLTIKETLIPKLTALYEIDKEAKRKKLSHSIVPRSRLFSMSGAGWWRVAAAASVIILLSVSAWWIFNTKKEKQPVLTQQEQQPRFKNDVEPGGNKATLVLGNGTKIDLNSAQDGSLGKEGNTAITKQEGELKYQRSGPSTPLRTTEISYNTLSTPKGGYYKLVLPDGSKVWLNAESSIRYPTEFANNERKVEVNGELYFEVRKDTKKIFKVAIHPSTGGAGGGLIEVLGTHFNVNAYANEEAIRTTLLEGKVRIVNEKAAIANKQYAILQPGEQALLNNNNIKVVDHANLEETVAWVNNSFMFNDLTIRPLMRQLARWYDVEVEFKEEVNTHFIATIPRTVTLKKVLEVLEMTGGVHFEIDGKKITVRK